MGLSVAGEEEIDISADPEGLQKFYRVILEKHNKQYPQTRLSGKMIPQIKSGNWLR